MGEQPRSIVELERHWVQNHSSDVVAALQLSTDNPQEFINLSAHVPSAFARIVNSNMVINAFALQAVATALGGKDVHISFCQLTLRN